MQKHEILQGWPWRDAPKEGTRLEKVKDPGEEAVARSTARAELGSDALLVVTENLRLPFSQTHTGLYGWACAGLCVDIVIYIYIYI